MSVLPVRGEVTIEARDGAGALVERFTRRNAYTLLGATEHAKALNGEPSSIALTHIGIGPGGVVIDTCEATTGWTTSGLTAFVADTSTFRDGTASLRADLALSTSGTAYHSNALSGAICTGGAVEVWLKVNYRGRVSLASSALQVYTTGGRFDVTFAAIEAANSAFVDGTWALCRIPFASFTTGTGTPSWASVTGVGLALTATAAGALSVWIDHAAVYIAPDVSSAATSIPCESSRQALSTLTRSGRVVTADAFWTSSQAVGQAYMAGLYAGSVLVSALSFPYYKQAGLTLRVTWTLTTQGG